MRRAWGEWRGAETGRGFTAETRRHGFISGEGCPRLARMARMHRGFGRCAVTSRWQVWVSMPFNARTGAELWERRRLGVRMPFRARKAGSTLPLCPRTPRNWPWPRVLPGGNPLPVFAFRPIHPSSFALALPSCRIYRAVMRNAVNRVPAETDCPGWGLGKTGGEALPLVKSPGLVGFRGIGRLRWRCNGEAT